MTALAIFFVTVSAFIDIIANMMIAKSQGFRKVGWGIGAIVLVWIAFALLGQAVKTMDLAVAYAMWGGDWRHRYSRVWSHFVWPSTTPDWLVWHCSDNGRGYCLINCIISF